MNLQAICGSIGGIRVHRNEFLEIDLEDVDVEALLDDIGREYVKEHFGLQEIPCKDEGY